MSKIDLGEDGILSAMWDKLEDVDWKSPKTIAVIIGIVAAVGGIAYILLASSSAPMASVRIEMQGKPIAGATVYAENQNGVIASFGPTNGEGEVKIPIGSRVVQVKLPDGKTVSKTAYVAGPQEVLSLEAPFKKTVTFYVTGASGVTPSLKVFVDGKEELEEEVHDGIATVNFGKDVVITPDNTITFQITAPGYQTWELNTDGLDLKSIYNITLIQNQNTAVPTGDIKVTLLRDGNAVNGRVDLYDQTGTVVSSSYTNGGIAEFKGIPYGKYTIKIFDENGAYLTEKQILVNKQEIKITIKLMSLSEALKEGIVKKITTKSGKTEIVPTAQYENNAQTEYISAGNGTNGIQSTGGQPAAPPQVKIINNGTQTNQEVEANTETAQTTVVTKKLPLQEAIQEGLVKTVTIHNNKVVVPARKDIISVETETNQSSQGISGTSISPQTYVVIKQVVRRGEYNTTTVNVPPSNPNIPAGGTYQSMPEYNTQTGAGLILPENSNTSIAIVNGTPSVPVTVYVLTKDGNPITDAVATIRIDNTKLTKTADSSGAIRFGLHEDQCAKLQISAKGYVEKNTSVCAGEHSKVVMLSPTYVTGNLQITVISYNGAPVDNAKVVLMRNGDVATKPAYTSNGMASITHMEVGQYIVKVEKSGMVGEMNVSVDPNRTKTVVITLYPGMAQVNITVSGSGVPSYTIKVIREDTGQTVATAKLEGQTQVTLDVPAILPVQYILETSGGRYIVGPTMHLAPGEQRNIDINVPTFQIPGIKILGIYHNDQPTPNLPIGTGFTIEAIVGSAGAGTLSVKTSDPDDITVYVSDNSHILPGYTFVKIGGYVTQYPLHTHATITIYAPGAEKSITLPIGDMMTCTQDFCYTIRITRNGQTVYYNGDTSYDADIIAGQKLKIKTTLLYTGKRSTEVNAKIILRTPNGKEITLLSGTAWHQGKIEENTMTLVVNTPGRYVWQLLLVTPAMLQQIGSGEFGVGNKLPMYLWVEPNTLLRTNLKQTISVAVAKTEDELKNDVYFQPAGLIYHIYGVRYNGNHELIRTITNTSSPQPITISGVGKYKSLIIDAEAQTYGKTNANITLVSSPVSITPNSISLYPGNNKGTIKISNPIYPLTLSVSVSKNANCDLNFHVSKDLTVLDPRYGETDATIHVWYTGGDNCASTVGGDVTIKISHDGEQIYAKSIPVLAYPHGHCIKIGMQPVKSGGKTGTLIAIVKNVCAIPADVNITVETQRAIPGTTIDAKLWDPTLQIPLGTQEANIIQPNKSIPVEIHYTLGTDYLQPVLGGYVTLRVTRKTNEKRGPNESGTWSEKDQNTTEVYTTDVSNCLSLQFKSRKGDLQFIYDSRSRTYYATKTLILTVGRDCNLIPNELTIELEGPLAKHARIDWAKLKGSLINVFNTVDTNYETTRKAEIPLYIYPKDAAPLYQFIIGELNASAYVEPVTGPMAGKHMFTSTELTVFSEKQSATAKITGSGTFNGEYNEIVVPIAQPQLSFGGEIYQGTRPTIKEINIAEACIPSAGSTNCSGGIPLHGDDNATVDQWGIIDMNIGYNPTLDLKRLLNARTILIDGNILLNDENIIKFWGTIQLTTPTALQVSEPSPSPQYPNYSQCYTINAVPEFATGVSVVPGAGAQIWIENSKEGPTENQIIAEEGNTVCVIAKAPSSCSKQPVNVTLKFIPEAYNVLLKSWGVKESTEVNAIPTEEVSISPDINPFDASSWKKALSAALTDPQNICNLSNAIYPSSDVNKLINNIKKNPQIWPDTIKIPVYYDNVKPIHSSKGISINENNPFGYCTITNSQPQVTVDCEPMSAATTRYADAWKALQTFLKVTKTRPSLWITDLELPREATALSTVTMNVGACIKNNEFPVVIYNTGVYMVDWNAIELKVPSDVKCTTNEQNAIVVKNGTTYIAAWIGSVPPQITCGEQKITPPTSVEINVESWEEPQQIDVNESGKYIYIKTDKIPVIKVQEPRRFCYEFNADSSEIYLILSKNEAIATSQKPQGCKIKKIFTKEDLSAALQSGVLANHICGSATLIQSGHWYGSSPSLTMSNSKCISEDGQSGIKIKNRNSVGYLIIYEASDPNASSSDHCGDSEYLYTNQSYLPLCNSYEYHKHPDKVYAAILPPNLNSIKSYGGTESCQWTVFVIPLETETGQINQAGICESQ